jgi:hypothetical protein
MNRSYGPVLFFLLTTASAVLLLNASGTDDVKTLQTWSHIIEQHGPIEGYTQSGADYPPLSVLLIAAAVQRAEAQALPGAIGIKGLILLFLLLTSLVFYALTRNLGLTTLLQGAFLINGPALGYVDVLFAPPLLLALAALERRRLAWATALFAVACLLKWQVLVIAPFVLLQMIEIRSLTDWRAVPWRRLAGGVIAPALLLTAATLLLFRAGVLLSFWYALTKSTYLSGTALNLGWVVTYLLHLTDPATYGPLTGGQIGIIVNPGAAVAGALKLLFVAVFGTVLVLFFRANKTSPTFLRYATLGYLAYFTFNTGVHENHLFLAVLLLAWLAHRERATLLEFGAWATLFNLNMVVFYGLDGRGLPFSPVVAGVDMTLPLALLGVLLFVGFLARVHLATVDHERGTIDRG